MKRVALVVFAVLIAPVSLFAASIGGVATQGEGNFSLSADVDYMFSRDMGLDSSTMVVAGEDLKDIDISSHYIASVKGSYGILPNVDVYLKLGFSDFEADADLVSESRTIASLSYDGELGFAYGIGAKGTYNTGMGYIVGADIQYIRSDNEFDLSGLGVRYSGDAEISAFHFAPFVAMPMETYTPYIGCKLSTLTADLDVFGSSTEVDEDDSFGAFIGADFLVDANTIVSAELRLFDETALAVSAAFKF